MRIYLDSHNFVQESLLEWILGQPHQISDLYNSTKKVNYETMYLSRSID